MRRPILAMALLAAAALLWVALLSPTASASPHVSGAIFTTLEDGTRVNANIYDSKLDVYLDGGPGPNAPQTAAGLPDGNYYFQVTDPSGKTLLSSDAVKCREFRVEGGIIVEYLGIGRQWTKNGNGLKDCWADGHGNGKHDTGYDVDHGALTIQLMPYDNTPNKGGVYKAWATPVGNFVGDPEKIDNSCGTGCFHGFLPAFSKTDNFKVRHGGPQFQNPLITVRKFVDTDGDGVWDQGEPEVGITYFIDGGGWPVSVADPNGITSDGFTPYQYLPGFAGAYVVTEGLPSGWSQTAAYLDGVAQTVSVDVTVNVAFTSGETHEVVYGNFQCFEVSGTKINDLNGNGVLNDGEPGIAGWTIYLFRNGGTEPYATTYTDENGDYSFTVCQGGEYEVREGTPSGWTPISDPSFFFTAASGVDITGVDFYNFECFTVSGFKYDDTNGDGIHTGDEPGLAGWTVELVDASGAVVQWMTTGSDGFYTFTVCDPGTYTVREVLQDGWIATAPTSYSFTAVSGQGQGGNFLNFKLGSICGAKFYDANHNGVWDDDEPAIAGFLVELVQGGGVIDTATTTEDGFCFDGLLAGDYTVREVLPNNPDETHVWAQTFPSGDGQWDFTVTSGFSVDDANFGNVCEFTESRTWGYWKTHTGFDGPERDATYDDLPGDPLPVDVQTPDVNYAIDTDEEADWLFDGGAGDVNCSGNCVTLFRAQLLALHMSLLKFGDMGDQIYVNPGDAYDAWTVQAIHDAAVADCLHSNYGEYTSFQQTLDAINNNHNQPTGSRVLVCPDIPTPDYS